MTPRARMSQTLLERAPSQTVTTGRAPRSFALTTAPFGVRPSPWRRGKTPVPLAVLGKGLPPESELPLESP
jgi:hypothetical protein